MAAFVVALTRRTTACARVLSAAATASTSAASSSAASLRAASSSAASSSAAASLRAFASAASTSAASSSPSPSTSPATSPATASSSSEAVSRYDDQPAPVWPSDPTPLPDFQLRPAPRPNEPREARVRRLLYQSRGEASGHSKRGILENDILLGNFAAQHLPTLTNQELQLYDDLLGENDWDIYYWVTDAKPTPAKYQGRVLDLVRDIARNREHRVQRQPEEPVFQSPPAST